jgi:flagellar hook-associated protein 3 FlgL
MINGTRFRLDLEVNRQGRLAQAITRAQTEIATGKRILAPSDDPSGAAGVAEIGRAQANEATWLRNVDTAAALAARSDTVLGAVASSLDRAKELMLGAASATLSAADRQVIAVELRSLAEEVAASREARDPRGEPVFRTNGLLEIPVSAGIRIAPVAERDAIFGSPVDLVAAINAAADAALEPDGAARRTASTAALDGLDRALAQVALARADQGIRAERLEQMRERLNLSEVQLEEQKSGLESADVTEVIARLQSNQVSLQAAQAIFARLNQTSLFDLIR